MDIQEKIVQLGVIIPPPPASGGNYASIKAFGSNLLYVSGCGPNLEGAAFSGHLGQELSVEEGKKAAECCMLNVLSVLQAEIKDLNRVKSFVKLLVFVSSAPDFYFHPVVADGATELLEKLFGREIGLPTRSAVGIAALPGNIPVEIEAVIELYP